MQGLACGPTGPLTRKAGPPGPWEGAGAAADSAATAPGLRRGSKTLGAPLGPCHLEQVGGGRRRRKSRGPTTRPGGASRPAPGASPWCWRLVTCSSGTGSEGMADMTMLGRHLLETGQLRDGIDLEEVRDVLWTFLAIDNYERLVLTQGWPPERYSRWLAHAITSALCP